MLQVALLLNIQRAKMVSVRSAIQVLSAESLTDLTTRPFLNLNTVTLHYITMAQLVMIIIPFITELDVQFASKLKCCT